MQGSYGSPSGFYVSAQQQGGPYPPVPHASPVVGGPWPGYPPHMGPPHGHAYPAPQQQQQQQPTQQISTGGVGSTITSKDSTGPPVSTMDTPTVGSGGSSGNPIGSTSRPPSAGGQNPTPI